MFPYAVYRRGIKNRDALAGGNVASFLINTTGLSEPGVPGVPWHPHILTDQLTLLQSGEGTDYAKHITTGPPDFQTFLRPKK